MVDSGYLHATRASYDTVAVDYARRLRDELTTKPWDRAMLAVFAELVRGPVVDIGCGPGRVAAHLADLGLTVSGIDLSPQMVAVARRSYPELRFTEGSMLALELPDNCLGGVVAWYSLVHTPPEQLPLAFAEFHRVLAPGGHLLLAFKVGDERVHLDQAYGLPVSLDVYRFPPNLVAELVRRVGLVEVARLVREADESEKTPQAFLMARKP
ncbi:Methyltransferase domain-containing protein [Micromonospora pattaloongensis]|uniref:Methyltransferase domain-containing protein n=1 Tax=Micromonospora pattaloongensis TaxID=405436 RepID=A0A1H3GKT8_9ACTN|nr:class I SAM-dependent methyltransferase [Micromonospora pattaloongensis]SDY03605.1 Methyltransferase domain-containing protein [Micromonospora pattaloongensis]